jgi:hypothetical protein
MNFLTMFSNMAHGRVRGLLQILNAPILLSLHILQNLIPVRYIDSKQYYLR